MSMKTRVLLHRAGRDQFGNQGQPGLPKYTPSPEDERRSQQKRKEHEELNDKFVRKYREDWLEYFSSMSKKEIWGVLSQHGRPALGTFYKHVREHESLIDFLIYWLVSNKLKAMNILGHTRLEITAELSPFSECGRYYVTFGHGRAFGTTSI